MFRITNDLEITFGTKISRWERVMFPSVDRKFVLIMFYPFLMEDRLILP